MTWGREYWTWFLVVVSAAFLIPEIVALVTNVRNTLSWYSWTEMHVPSGMHPLHQSAAWFLSQGVFVVIAAWLLFHIWYHDFT